MEIYRIQGQKSAFHEGDNNTRNEPRSMQFQGSLWNALERNGDANHRVETFSAGLCGDHPFQVSIVNIPPGTKGAGCVCSKAPELSVLSLWKHIKGCESGLTRRKWIKG